MKRYKFRLEAVRRVRRTQEEMAKAVLAQANTEVREAEAVVEARMADYQRSLDNPAGSTAQSLMAARHMASLSWQSVLAARAQVEVAQAKADECKASYMEAAQRVKALDRLDERRREEYRIEYDREVQADMDDLSSGHRKSGDA